MDAPQIAQDEKSPALRILIVDDHQDNARMLQILLKVQGYQVKLAFAGLEAIERAKEFHPDVVLLDLILPDINGAEVAERLQEIEGFERTKFVAVSGYTSDRISSIFHHHFIKPVDHDALNDFLARATNEARKSPACE